MKRYKVSFILNDDRKKECVVEAYGRFRAMALALIATSIRSFKGVEIKKELV